MQIIAIGNISVQPAFAREDKNFWMKRESNLGVQALLQGGPLGAKEGLLHYDPLVPDPFRLISRLLQMQ